MAIQFEAHERINRPVVEVFEYVSTWENAEQWHPSISEITPMDDALGEGSRWSETWETTVGTTEDYEECIGYDPPNRFGLETENGLLDGRIRTSELMFDFSEDGDGTRVTISGTTQVNGILSLLQPLFGPMFGDAVEGHLAGLKSTLEEPAD